MPKTNIEQLKERAREEFDKQIGNVYHIRRADIGDIDEITEEVKTFIDSLLDQAIQIKMVDSRE